MQPEAVTTPAPLIQTVIVFPRYLKRFPISLHCILLMMAFERNVRRRVTELRAQSRHAFLHAILRQSTPPVEAALHHPESARRSVLRDRNGVGKPNGREK